jgi:hypothetical protein
MGVMLVGATLAEAEEAIVAVAEEAGTEEEGADDESSA